MKNEDLINLKFEVLNRYKENGIYLGCGNLSEFNGDEGELKLLKFLKINLNDVKYSDLKIKDRLEDEFPFYFYFPFYFSDNEQLKLILINLIRDHFPLFSTCLLGEIPKQCIIIYKNKIEFNQVFKKENSKNSLIYNIFEQLISISETIEELKNKNLSENSKDINEENEKNNYVLLSNKKRISPDDGLKKAEKKKIIDEKIYLPQINQIHILESNCNSVLFKTLLITRKMIKEKNSSNVFAFDKKTKQYKLSYVIYILNLTTKLFDFKKEIFIEEKNNEDTQINNLQQTKFIQLEIDKLEENKLYTIKLFCKFGEYISSLSNLFNIRTSFKIVCSKDKNQNKNEEEYVDLISKYTKFTYIEYNEFSENLNLNDDKNFILLEVKSETDKFIKEYQNTICDFYMTNDKLHFLTSNSEVFFIGKVDENINLEENNEILNNNELEETITNEPLLIVNPIIQKNFYKIPLIKISTGNNFTLGLDTSGSVFSWGKNNFGQLGINIDYSWSCDNPRKINFNVNNELNDIYIYDIATTKYSCMAIGIKNGKQRVFSWGLGEGSEKIQQEIIKANIISEFSIIVNYNLISNMNFYRINTPKLIDNRINESGSILKIFSRNHFFSILTTKDNINICYFYGFFRSPGFLMEVEKKESIYNNIVQNEYILYENEFFRIKNLSIMDISIGNDYMIFLVKNLHLNKNELYSFGLNKYGNCGLTDKNFYSSPTKIINNKLRNPLKLKTGKDFSYVFVEEESEEINYLKLIKIYRIGFDKEIFMENKLISEILCEDDLIKIVNIPKNINPNDIYKLILLRTYK